MQRIEVKNFGPLKDINLEIKDYMVFIGPQASGKSTLAKLIYFFWKVETDIYRKDTLTAYTIDKISNPNADVNDSVTKFKIATRDVFFSIFPTHRNGRIKFTFLNESFIEIDVARFSEESNDDIIIDSSFFADFSEIDAKILSIRNKDLEESENTDITKNKKKDKIDFLSSAIIIGVLAAFFIKVNQKNIFIPAGRSILSALSNSYTFLDNDSLDYFNETFGKLTNKIRKFLTSPDYENLFGKNITNSTVQENVFSLSDSLSLQILKGDFVTGSNGDGIMQYYNNSDYFIQLKYTSSGQQESAWVINTIKYLLSESNDRDIIIEEPEAHLFPDAQRHITNLITLLHTQESESKTRLISTTHSPYILATLNNSIKAYTTAQIENKSEEVEKILSKEFWINPENLFVGFMNKNEGEDNFGIQNIFDKELGLIDHEVLDKVSDDIMKQFDELLDIQYSDD